MFPRTKRVKRKGEYLNEQNKFSTMDFGNVFFRSFSRFFYNNGGVK